MNRNLLELDGTTISLSISFSTSANGCSSPNGPTRFGPMRAWIDPITRRSASVRNAMIRMTLMNRISATTDIPDDDLDPFRQEGQQAGDELRNHGVHAPGSFAALHLELHGRLQRRRTTHDRIGLIDRNVPRRRWIRERQLRLQRALVGDRLCRQILRQASQFVRDLIRTQVVERRQVQQIAEHAQHLPAWT